MKRDLASDGKAAEDALAHQRLLYEAVLSTTPDLAYIFDRDHRFIYANEGLLRMWGKTWDEAIGKNCLELGYEPWHAEMHDREIERVVATKQPIRGVVPFTGAFGRRLYDYIFTPVLDANGEVKAVAGTTRDITDIKQNEEALRASEAKYRTLFESIDEGFCVVEVIFDERDKPVDYRFLEVNPAFERQTGLTAARGRTIRELAPGHEEHWFEIYGRIARTGQAARFELPAAGLHRWYDVYAWRHGDSDRRQVAVLFNDITVRKQAEAALRESVQRKDEFLAMLSHELRNPLAPIRNAVSLLQEADGEAPVREQARAILDRQVGQLTRLVDDLLDIARISRGSISLRKEIVRLDEIVAGAIETSRPLIEDGSHQLYVDLPQGPIRLSADRVRLTQVISNLLNNAARYTPSGGRIDVTAHAAGGELSITVRDNGIGIDPQQLAGVFDMFFQAGNGRQLASGGLGVGLALARQLVELHGGSIEARSEGVSRGSEFTIRVPLPILPALAREAARPPVPESGRRVLIAEDNTDAAQSLGLLLRKMGHAVRLSYDGAAALEDALREPPEIVLLDIDMPKLDGYAVASRLREDRRFDRVPIVALTGLGQDLDRRRSRQAGFDHHVLKPVDISALREALELIRGDEQHGAAPATGATPSLKSTSALHDG